MDLSISTSRAREPWKHKAFRLRVCSTAQNVARTITSEVWAPIIWQGGDRRTENFIYSDCAVFDFDSGEWTIEKARDYFAAYKCIIAPTKSHRKQKDTQPAVDRFRVVIPWETRISHYGTYRQNLERLYGPLPCDKQCKDGARMYQPSTSIFHVSAGKSLEVGPYREIPQRQCDTSFARRGVMPDFIKQMMTENPAPGLRNKHCFRIAAKLAEMGFSEHDCISAVMSCAVEIPLREKEITAKSGYRFGRKTTNALNGKV